jgi:hypothetical protein
LQIDDCGRHCRLLTADCDLADCLAVSYESKSAVDNGRAAIGQSTNGRAQSAVDNGRAAICNLQSSIVNRQRQAEV